MDTGRGRFEIFDDKNMLKELYEKYPNHGAIFTVGELLEIKGSRFKITEITQDGLKLRLLPRT